MVLLFIQRSWVLRLLCLMVVLWVFSWIGFVVVRPFWVRCWVISCRVVMFGL